MDDMRASFSEGIDRTHNGDMLVTFRTDAYANITMFGDIAVSLLRMMGHSGTVPSALLAKDVPEALERLKAAVAKDKAAGGAPPGGVQDDDSEEPRVSLANRAFPLIELLEAAAKRKSDVMWDR
ncbi:MAG TPA: DUF1840 domain-containing protein [Burkholderiales bacterium]|jgi:hypothetical protein|nr:DUF1840 domain-containing protein [Burkholderiales bacterium]